VGDAPERLLHHERDAGHPGLSGTRGERLSKERRFMLDERRSL